MTSLPADGLSLSALVLLLGLRHGFDPDHLVAIDRTVPAGTACFSRSAMAWW
jgi:high-affinity nickel permease